ncbi:uncharacterized protein LOC126983834 [Eriocheir sinensis]|uniref:uncharacterized protein LOC126983834 n=1 Tax=Eriocheir sinensis TaxID=95602 RepID=UPI0021C6C8B7|nr:uncharacterized protein LOC126983834 [Eriocheir sinensis]
MVSTQYFILESKDEVRQRVFKGISGSIADCYAARQDIASGQYAAICDRISMKKAMSWDFSTSGQCHLYASRDNVYTNVPVAMAFSSNSTYRAGADRIIFAVKEAGILDKWLGEQITNTSQCLRPPTADRSDGITPLNIEDMAGSFLMLAGGLAASTAVFLLEVTAPRL